MSYARDYSKVKYNMGTPFTGEFTAERFTGDSIEFYAEGNYIGNSHGKTIYKRSKDGLRDTVFDYSGVIRVREFIYSPEGKLVTLNMLWPDIENKTEQVWITDYATNYEYDAEGRIAVITTVQGNDSGSKFYDYTANTIVTKTSGGTLIDSIFVVYNDSGYVCHMTDSYYGDYTVEYVFDSENRLLRSARYRPYFGDKSEVLFTYHDHGYWEYRGDLYKTEYIYFEKESQLKKETAYELTYKGWEVRNSYDYVYHYGDDILDVDQLAIEKTAKIYGVTGGVAIESEAPVQVAIYAFGGQLIERRHFDSGSYQIPMLPGFYLVQAGKDVFKVKVR